MGDEQEFPDDEPQDMQEETLPGPQEDQRAEIEAGHDEAMQGLEAEPQPDPAATQQGHDNALASFSEQLTERPPSAIEQAKEVPTDDLGDEPPPPVDAGPAIERRRAEHDAMLRGMPSDTEAYAGGGGDFEAAVAEFNGGGIGGGDSTESQDNGGPRQLLDSMFEHEGQQDEMLIDAARRLDEMTRALESERL